MQLSSLGGQAICSLNLKNLVSHPDNWKYSVLCDSIVTFVTADRGQENEKFLSTLLQSFLAFNLSVNIIWIHTVLAIHLYCFPLILAMNHEHEDPE
jgi:hypothetical protein